MKLLYYQDSNGNFGDDLNLWLWPKLMPGVLDDDGRCLFLGIGSILSRRMNIPARPLKLAFGCGVGYGEPPDIDERWKIYCVRGPLSAAALKLSPSIAVTDAAVLIRRFTPPLQAKKHRAIFMPHHRSLIRAQIQGVDLRRVCEDAGIFYVDPSVPVEEVLQAIAQTGVVIAEAMHVAIVADAMRVPWIPIRFYDHILDFKWKDWTSSLQLDYQPVLCSSADMDRSGSMIVMIKKTLKEACPILSSASIFEQVAGRLEEKFEEFLADHRSGKLAALSQCKDAAEETAASQPISAGGNQDEHEVWLKRVLNSAQTISQFILPQESFILADGDEFMTGGVLGGRRVFPFLEENGQYAGAPADDDAAIEELKRLRGSGAKYLVFAWPAFWWLEHYLDFFRHVRSRFRCLLENERVLIFDLREETSQ